MRWLGGFCIPVGPINAVIFAANHFGASSASALINAGAIRSVTMCKTVAMIVGIYVHAGAHYYGVWHERFVYVRVNDDVFAL